MRSATKPRRNEASDARMLAAVAAGSPRTTLRKTYTEKPAGAPLIRYSAAASLALTRGDEAAVRPGTVGGAQAVEPARAGTANVCSFAPQIKSQKMIGSSPISKIIANDPTRCA